MNGYRLKATAAQFKGALHLHLADAALSGRHMHVFDLGTLRSQKVTVTFISCESCSPFDSLPRTCYLTRTVEPSVSGDDAASAAPGISAEMPGKVVKFLVEAGAFVNKVRAFVEMK